MNILCTLYIGSKKLGTIISLSSNINSVDEIHQKLKPSKSVSPVSDTSSSIRFNSPDDIFILIDEGVGQRVDLQLCETEVVDEPLRGLSSNKYVILTDKSIMYGDSVYRTFGAVPSCCKWHAIPMVGYTDIIEYESSNPIDENFLREGYAKELKQAEYVLVPPNWYDLSPSCTPYDLLIRKKDNNKYIPFSGRNGVIPEPINIDGRYIYLPSTPIFEGKLSYPPFTYNLKTLIFKYRLLQDRLNEHGKSKVNSICTSMNSIALRLRDINNQFMASNVYNDIVEILEKLREME